MSRLEDRKTASAVHVTIAAMSKTLFPFRLIAFIALITLLAACAPLSERQAGQTSPAAALQTTTALILTQTPSPSRSPTTAQTFTPTASITHTLTPTPTPSRTATITTTPTITLTATYDFPDVTVNTQAHCRYGPSSAYLHAADLYPGDTGTVRGRYRNSAWLYIKFDKLNYFCWASPSVIDVTGDISLIYYTEPKLQSIGSNQYGPPHNVQVRRDGNQVTITWDRMDMTVDKDRGYFIEAWVCQNGAYLWWTVSFPDQYTTSYTVQDDPGCSTPSTGSILTVEKHGYSEPVQISWPAP